MRERHVGDLVVVDEGRPIGMLTDRDLVVAVLAKDVDPSSLRVEDVMSANVITTTEDEDVDDVLRRMRQFAVRRMPVVDARDVVVGMVTVDDVLDRLAEEVSEVVAIVRRERSEELRRRP
jgi:CBS domain-containing protein